MKKYAFILLVAIFANALHAQAPSTIEEPTVGSVFEIGEASAEQFEHIKFPRANFIIKRGGMPNYKVMKTVKVVVTSVKERKNGSTKVYIKRADGKRFFGSHLYVATDFNAALASGELR